MIRNRRGNVFVVLLLVVLALGLFLVLTRFTSHKEIIRDNTPQAVTESDTAVRKAVFTGVGKAMHEGLALQDKAWFCNRPLPPSYLEANLSLKQYTEVMLSHYYEGLQREGYYEHFDDIFYNISFPAIDNATIKIPGNSVIVTDHSGSMAQMMGGQVKWVTAKDVNLVLIRTVFNRTPGAKIGLVSYDYDARVDHQVSDDQASLEHTIESMADPLGGTCIACGIYRAVQLLVPAPPPANFSSDKPLNIVVMSDGEANINFDSSDVQEECLLLDASGDPKSQAIEFARQAHEKYGIEVYAVGFGEAGGDFDLATMQTIAQVGGSNYPNNFAYAADPAELAAIYANFGNAIAKYVIKNYTYLRLENDQVMAIATNVTAGIDRENLMTRQDISDSYVWNFKTWYLYKNLVNWLVFYGEQGVLGSIPEQLASYKPCRAVFYDTNGCPSPGRVYNSSIEKFLDMQLSNEDMRPLKILEDIDRSMARFLLETNITCTSSFVQFDVNNTPLFNFGVQPTVIPINMPFGNGTFLQTSVDGITPRVECPLIGSPAREDFLKINSSYRLGLLGPNSPLNEVCSAASPYQYIGIDRTFSMEILVSCSDPTIGQVMDGPRRFEPLTLEFILRIDMMSDCDPPLDQLEQTVTC